MFTGSLGAVSNRENWQGSFSFLDGENAPLSVAAATSIVMFVTDPDTPNNAIISGSLSDVITISVDGLTVNWNFPPDTMNKLCAGTFSVFARMVLAGVTEQIFSAATISIQEGGPA